jgi:type VI secretion system protein ImpG
MDPLFLRYYNRELQYIREMGAEFARDFPKIAGRLGIESFEVADPYVERLLEGFAFLTARLQLKIDSEFPRFTQHLFEILYPHYLGPTPSMAVVEIKPSLTEGALATGYPVPRGTVLRSVLGRGDQTACEYRTGHAVTLWPLEITFAEYTSYVGDLGGIHPRRPARAALRLRLRATAGLSIADLPIDELTFFVRGSEELPMRLYELILAHGIGVRGRSTAGPGPWQQSSALEAASPVGFADAEALLPYGPRSFQGYRLLHEYFAFPQRYLFFKLDGLRPLFKGCTSSELELLVATDRHDPTLDGAVSAANFALHATPAINLFPRRADRIQLSEGTAEYHVVPDRTRPMDFEVCSVTEVVGFGASAESKQVFHPFYAWNDLTDGQTPLAYYTIERQPRALSEKQRARGARSSYVGSELFIALVDPSEAPYRSSLRQLAIETLCSNRDLPLHMALGQGRTDFTLESGAPVEAVRCLAGPTAPRASHAHGETSWRLVSHLSLNHLSLVGDSAGAAALRELLSLYADLSDPTTRKQIDGVRSTSSGAITRALPFPGPTTFGRGLEITLTCDETAFEGAGVFLLGAVLERFFAKYVSINSFTETVLRTVQRGDVMRWPARLGLENLV